MHRLGRTNKSFPPIWLSLSTPHERSEGWLDRLVGAALEADVPVDVTSQPALWGGAIRRSELHDSATLMAIGGHAMEQGTDEAHSADLVQSQLIEVLCGIGRERLDMYFLRVRRSVEEYQISGALQALEAAKQEGHIGFVGLSCDGPAVAALAMWQFHDGFEILLVPRSHADTSAYDMLSPMAKERRVGIVIFRPFNWAHGVPFPLVTPGAVPAASVLSSLSADHPVLVGVREPAEIAEAITAPASELPPAFEEKIARLRRDLGNERTWNALEEDPREWLSALARRRHDAR